MADVKKIITVGVEAIIGNSAEKLDEFAKNTKGLETNLKGVAGASDVASVAMGVFTGKLAVDIAERFGKAIGETILKIRDLGLETQQTISKTGAMKNFIGDATQAYQYFNAVGRNTNYDLGAVQQMGAQLLNMGYSAQNAAKMIQLCADTAAGLNKGQAGAQQLIDTLSRIQATGEMSSRQMIALQQSGLDMDKAFESLGMTAEDAMQAMDDGTLNAQDAVAALIDYMSTFDGKMAESKQNIIDEWGDVEGNMTTICASIGGAIFEAFDKSGIVQTLVDFTQDLLDLVWSDGTSAFSEFGTIAQWALDAIDAGLEIVRTAVKAVIVVFYKLNDAARNIGSTIAGYLAPILRPLQAIWDKVKSIVSTLGGAVQEYVGTAWSELVGPSKGVPREYDESENHFHTARRTPKASGGSAGGTGSTPHESAPRMSQEEREQQRQVDALIKKYTDWTAIRQANEKAAIEEMKVRATMLTGEAKADADRKVKLAEYKKTYDDLIDSYEKEIKLAENIQDNETRQSVADRISEQERNAKELYEAQIEALQYAERYKQQQANSKELMSTFGADPNSIKAYIDAIKTSVTDAMAEIDSALAQPVDSEQLSAVAQILGKTPDALQEEMDAKGTTIQEFMDNYKNQLVEAAEAESNQLKNSQIWKDTMKSYWNDVSKSLGDAFYDIITGAKSAGDALADFVSDSIKNALKMASEWLGLVAIFAIGGNPAPGKAASKALFGMNFATGGYVAGPGTGTSDSIPAMLSNGEYVIRASAVRNIGVPTLNALNRGAYHFADGGYVGGNKLEPSGIAGNLTLQVNALDASDFDNFLNLRGGAEHIQNMLYEAERRFAFSMG